MDGILRQQGMTRGTVGERMTALGKDPRFAFAENDEGRARLMDFLKARVADMRTRLPRAFNTLVPGNFEIKRMAPEVEPGAPGAYGGPGSIDGKDQRQVLDQHAQHERVHDLQHADAHLPRVPPRPRVAGRVHLQTTAVPLAAGVQRLLGRLGAVRRAIGRRARRLRRRPVRPARLPAVDRVPRLPAGGGHRPARPALDAPNRPSSGSQARTARRSTKSRAKWIATAHGPARPADTRWDTARSTGCGPRRSRRWGSASTSASSTTRW